MPVGKKTPTRNNEELQILLASRAGAAVSGQQTRQTALMLLPSPLPLAVY